MQQRVKRWQDGGDILLLASIGTNSRRCMQQRLERWQDGGDILLLASIGTNSRRCMQQRLRGALAGWW
jgi:hypothetical protein